jgi:hypothetical protein
MAERGRPRVVGQRNLDPAPDPKASDEPKFGSVLDAAPIPAPELPPIPRDPSGTALRDRQRDWLRERERVDRRRASTAPPKSDPP